MDIFIDNKSFEAPEKLTSEFLDEIEREFDMKFFDLVCEERVIKIGDDISPGEYSLKYNNIKKMMDKFESIEHVQCLWFLCRDPEDISIFLEYGIDINSRDTHGETLLASLSIMNYDEVGDMIDTLIEYGADIEAKDSKGRSCLMRSVIAKKIEIVKKFIDSGADVNTTDNYSITPLAAVCSNGELEIVKLLVNANADMEKRVPLTTKELDLLI